MLNPDERAELIERLRQFPLGVIRVIEGLTPEQLQTPYAPGKWTVEQVIHHCADTHMVALVRTKCILAEDNPDMIDYDQDTWARLPDAHHAPVNFSQIMLLGIHNRWCALLEGLTEADWQRAGTHPRRGRMTIEDMLVHYTHHGENHLKSILDLCVARGWAIPDAVDSEPTK